MRKLPVPENVQIIVQGDFGTSSCQASIGSTDSSVQAHKGLDPRQTLEARSTTGPGTSLGTLCSKVQKRSGRGTMFQTSLSNFTKGSEKGQNKDFFCVEKLF